jgi:hypothetical protein
MFLYCNWISENLSTAALERVVDSSRDLHSVSVLVFDLNAFLMLAPDVIIQCSTASEWNVASSARK